MPSDGINPLGRIGLPAFIMLCFAAALLGAVSSVFIFATIDAAVSPGTEAVSGYYLSFMFAGLLLPIIILIAKRRSARRKLSNLTSSASSNQSPHTEAAPYLSADDKKRSNLVAVLAIVLLSLLWKPILAIAPLAALGWLFWKGDVPTTGLLSSLSSRGARIATLSTMSILIIAGLAATPTGSDSAAELPDCDSNTAKNNLKSAIEDGPSSYGHVKVFSTKDLKQCGVKESANGQLEIRACSANLYTNAGQLPTEFHMKWIDKPKGEWFLQTASCPWFGVVDGDLGWKKNQTVKPNRDPELKPSQAYEKIEQR